MSAVILLIHDDLLAQRFITHVLEVQGSYVIVAVAYSNAALSALHQHDKALMPDVVVTGGRQHAAVMASTRAQLLQTVWAGQSFVEERTVDVHVYRLRNQLARYGYGHLIEAVRGSGYRCAAEVPRKPAPTGAAIRFAP